MKSILIVDDEVYIRKLLRAALESEGYLVIEGKTGLEALDVLKQEPIDLIISDLLMPKMDGIELLKRVMKIYPQLPFIVMTAHGTVETAVQAMQIGASDYITKPFKVNELQVIVKKLLHSYKAQQVLENIHQSQKSQFSLENIIGNSPTIQQTFELIEKISQSPRSTVLIEGESGTGKNLIARAIHYSSARATEPYLEVNCSSLPSTLLESELFGHEQGAFTDARKTKKGLFEAAEGGSLLLDEISLLEYPLQGKLLGVLEDRFFRRVGGTKNIDVNVRVMAATNQDLKDSVQRGDFRKDLFFRLHVINIKLPPLRERNTDIILLSEYFVQQFAKEFKKESPDLSDSAKKKLMAYSWPGNVRELKNTIERAMLLSSGKVIEADDILIVSENMTPEEPYLLHPKRFRLPPDGLNFEEFERDMLIQALDQSNGVQSAAARLLGMSRYTFRYRLQKFNIPFHDSEQD